jgi:hypothetical protein
VELVEGVTATLEIDLSAFLPASLQLRAGHVEGLPKRASLHFETLRGGGRSFKLDERGLLQVDRLPPGRYRVSLWGIRTGFRTRDCPVSLPLELAPGEQASAHLVFGARRVWLRAVGADTGRPLAGWGPKFEDEWGSILNPWGNRLDAEGRMLLPTIPQGRIKVNIGLRDFGPLPIPPGDEVTVTIRFPGR